MYTHRITENFLLEKYTIHEKKKTTKDLEKEKGLSKK